MEELGDLCARRSDPGVDEDPPIARSDEEAVVVGAPVVAGDRVRVPLGDAGPLVR
jgi:hypothetical protein